jgi:SagB-type dehydrogenase family enzyme
MGGSVIEISLRHNASLISAKDGSIIAASGGRRMALRGVPGLEKALGLLADGPARLSDLLMQLDQDDLLSKEGRRLGRALILMARRQLIEFHYVTKTGVLLTAIPTGALAAFDFDQLDMANGASANTKEASVRYRLSRFTCIHRVDDWLEIECPQQSMRLTTRAPEIGAMVAALTELRDPGEIASLALGLGSAPTRQSVAFLTAFGAVQPAGPDGRLAEDADRQLAQREFHDVLMHMQSRWGLTDAPIGGTFRFAGSISPSPAIKPRMADRVIDLPVPDMNTILHDDPPLGSVMENRRSIREYGEIPISKEQLGEFLFRVGRIRGLLKPKTDDPRQYEATVRTYPSGGAAYDLEIYVLANECLRLDRGFYHYEAAEHALSNIPCAESDMQRLLHFSYLANGAHVYPQLLFVICSRFSRLSWKYRGIAYATTLRNVGVLYEAMYLAATAMNLAPCALGSGDSATVAAMTSLDPMTESSVGEFMLGSAT